MEFNFDPVAFTIFGIDVRWYGIIIAFGVLMAMFVVNSLAKKENLDADRLANIMVFNVIFGVLGARIYYVIFQWDYYRGDILKMLDIRGGGLAIYGGIIAGTLVVLFFSKKYNESFFKLGDVFLPGVALAQGIGRWGNFINMEAYGGPTDLPWGLIIDGQKVHPTFLYESIGDIIIFLILYRYFDHRKNNGEVTFLYMILYGTLRFFVEGLRADSLYIGRFRVSQVLSAILVIAGIILFYVVRRVGNNKAENKE